MESRIHFKKRGVIPKSLMSRKLKIKFMATLQLTATSRSKNATATCTPCIFLVNGSKADVEVYDATGTQLIGKVIGVTPGNIAKIPVTIGTQYKYQINPSKHPCDATVTY